MNQQRLFSILSMMGVFFILFLGVQYVRSMNTRGDVIVQKLEVPDGLSNQFSRVITKNRVTPMTKTAFRAPDGSKVDWSNFEGKYLLVNFWATWCAPCVIELPSLDKLQKKFAGDVSAQGAGAGLEVISISLDTVRSQEHIKQFLYHRNISEFAAYLDFDGEIQRKIRMRGIPTSYLLDPDGNVLYIFEGDANWASGPAISFFTELLNP